MGFLDRISRNGRSDGTLGPPELAAERPDPARPGDDEAREQVAEPSPPAEDPVEPIAEHVEADEEPSGGTDPVDDAPEEAVSDPGGTDEPRVDGAELLSAFERVERNRLAEAEEEGVEPDEEPEPEDWLAEVDADEDATPSMERPRPLREEAGEDPEQRLTAEEALSPSRPQKTSTSHKKGAGKMNRAKVYAFANQKGGVAKTTSTLNLAVAFSESGHRVLCVDMDPQGNLTMSQGIDPDTVGKSMYDVLVNRMPIREVIHKREIDVAVASIDLAGAEIAMSAQIGRERALEKALGEVADDYDFVCIDTPPSLGLLTINALTAANKVIVPVQCEYLSMRGLVQLQNTLAMIREDLNPDVEIEGILPTMMDTRTVHAKEAIEILEENFGDRVFKARIRKTIKFAEAPVRGSSVLKYDPEGRAAKSYRDLAKEVLGNGAR